MAKVTCFICKDKIEQKNALKYRVEGQKVSKYFCSNDHFNEFLNRLELEKERRLDTDRFNEVDLYIAIEILQYELGQITPPNLKKRIQKLHKNYSYEVIKLCLELLKPELVSIINKKEFTDEQHMVNYIMVVVENHINDAYQIWKRRTEIARKQDSHSIDIDLMDEISNSKPTVVTTVNNGIMDFLEEDEY